MTNISASSFAEDTPRPRKAAIRPLRAPSESLTARLIDARARLARLEDKRAGALLAIQSPSAPALALPGLKEELKDLASEISAAKRARQEALRALAGLGSEKEEGEE